MNNATGASIGPGSDSQSTILAFGVAAVALPLSLYFLLRATSNDKVYNLGGIPIITAWSFFNKRYDFLRNHFKESGGKMFRFWVLQYKVTAVSGVEARRVFFNDSSLSVGEGYRMLLGGIPRLEDIHIDSNIAEEESIKRIVTLVRKDRVMETMPILLDDVDRRMADWGKEGKINPFKEVYDLVFQMTVRMASCNELANDPKAISELTHHYWNIEKSATPLGVLFPWFPGSAKKLKEKSTMALYMIFLKYVMMRRNSPTPSMDAIDVLIGKGDSDDSIVGTIMGIIFAGVINTGVNSCWALLHLGQNPEWKEKAVKELTALVSKYTEPNSTELLQKQLSSIPLSAWEDELPSLELIIRETLRMSMSFAAIRRNVKKDIQVDGVVIKKGEFLAYSAADVHQNPRIYTAPETFDPSRYLEGREEDKKEHFGYISWGVGRHPCAGMKIAKLEIKMILAMMLLGYDYTLVDKNGNYPKVLPQQDRNDLAMARPLGDPVYLKFKRVKD